MLTSMCADLDPLSAHMQENHVLSYGTFRSLSTDDFPNAFSEHAHSLRVYVCPLIEASSLDALLPCCCMLR